MSRAKFAQNRSFGIFGSTGSSRNLARSIGLVALCIFHKKSAPEASPKAISWPLFVFGQKSPTPEISGCLEPKRNCYALIVLLCFDDPSVRGRDCYALIVTVSLCNESSYNTRLHNRHTTCNPGFARAPRVHEFPELPPYGGN